MQHILLHCKLFRTAVYGTVSEEVQHAWKTFMLYLVPVVSELWMATMKELRNGQQERKESPDMNSIVHPTDEAFVLQILKLYLPWWSYQASIVPRVGQTKKKGRKPKAEFTGTEPNSKEGLKVFHQYYHQCLESRDHEHGTEWENALLEELTFDSDEGSSDEGDDDIVNRPPIQQYALPMDSLSDDEDVSVVEV